MNANRPAARALWTARAVGLLTVLFLAFDAVGKFLKPQAVADAFVRLGLPLSLAPAIGSLLLVLVVLYVIPKTRVLAAVLLTGYLGGAIAVNWRAGDPAFETLFPAIIGLLVWIPPYLLDARVRSLIPVVTESQVR
ncbi:MAG TPA: DoxX family protein [Candidatus Elarobacter sp.]|nr:DoxX family protein [Candidatus Elarobacter sp.]